MVPFYLEAGSRRDLAMVLVWMPLAPPRCIFLGLLGFYHILFFYSQFYISFELLGCGFPSVFIILIVLHQFCILLLTIQSKHQSFLLFVFLFNAFFTIKKKQNPVRRFTASSAPAVPSTAEETVATRLFETISIGYPHQDGYISIAKNKPGKNHREHIY